MAKFITLDNLTYFLGKVKTWVQGLGYQTASQVESAITGKGYQTASQVSGAISSATSDMATKTYVSSLGYQTSEQVNAIVSGKGYQTAQQVTSAIESATADMATDSELADAVSGMATQTWVGEQGYQTAANVNSIVDGKGFATTTAMNSAIGAAKTEMQSAINAAVSSVYEPKGSVAFASLPALAAGMVGDVYNVTDAFTTTASFVEGAGKKYPAGTNVVCVTDGDAQKWDVLSGMVDLSGYVQDSDLEAVTTTEIDAMFA